MYNQTLYNEMYSNTPIPSDIIEDDIVFNGYWLQNENIVVPRYDFESTNQSEYNSFNIPQSNWKGFLSRYWRDRDITIQWTLKANTKEELNNLIDELKFYVNQREWILKYKTTNWYRQIKATCVDIQIPREHYNITFIPFTIILKNNEPFFYDSLNNTALLENQTNPTIIEELTNNWSEVSKLQAYIIFNSADSVDEVKLTIWNIALTYDWNLQEWDVLLIDWLNEEVLLNTIRQDYNWTFPDLEKWFNSVKIEINGTYNAEIILIYRTNYV